MTSLRSPHTVAEVFRRLLLPQRPLIASRDSAIIVPKEKSTSKHQEHLLDGQIQIRPFRKADAQQVRGLFASSVIGRDAGLFIEDMRMSDPTDARKVSLAAIARSMFRFPLFCMFAAQVNKLTREGDLSDISKAFGIEECPSARSSRLTGKNGFWVAEWHREKGNASDLGGENELVGCVGLDSTTTAVSSNVSELRRMVVSPDYRRRGVAQKLLQAAVQHAREHEIKQIRLTTSSQDEGILKLYTRLGYQLKTHHRPSGFLDTLHVFELVLDVETFQQDAP